MPVTCGVTDLDPTGKWITAGQGNVVCAEDRHAPYVHDRHRADHGVRDYCWRWAMSGGTASSGGRPRLSCSALRRWLRWPHMNTPTISCERVVRQAG